MLSHLYPSENTAISGHFIHSSVKSIGELGVEIAVVSPVPWAPKVLWFRDKWRQYGLHPRKGPIDRVSVEYPRYVEFPGQLFRPYAGHFMYLSIKKTIERIAMRRRVQLLHAHTLTPDGLCGLHAARNLGIPLIVSIRGSDLHEYPFRSPAHMRAAKAVLRCADQVLCTSEALKTLALELEPQIRRIEHVYNGVDTAVFTSTLTREQAKRRFGFEPTHQVITSVGRCEAEKGIFELAAAFERLSRENESLRLVFAGDGKDIEAFRDRFASQGLEARACLTGKLSHSEIAHVLRGTDVFVFPSHGEGLPNALLEAMSQGLPCVATRVGGIPEVIHDGETGLLVDPHDSEALAHAIYRMLGNSETASGMGGRARGFVQSHLSWNANAVAHLRIYREMRQLGRGAH